MTVLNPKVSLLAVFTVFLLAGGTGAAPDSPAASDLFPRVETGRCANQERFVLVAHGGAVFYRNKHARKLAFLEGLLLEAQTALAAGASALDTVHAAAVAMEDSGVFNAGKGAIANRAGAVEMDASIMDGRKLAAGAVASVKTLKNPVDAARVVMERSAHVMMVGPGAEAFVSANGGTTAGLDYFLHGGRNFSDVALPEDLEILPPATAVAPERAAFSGLWAGVWSGELNHILAIEQVEADSAKLVFANGVAEYWGIDQASWFRATARFAGDALTFKHTFDSTWTITYRRNEADILSGTAVRESDGYTDKVVMRPWPITKGGTVGVVALDRCGDLAAATSTGGFGSKTPGRVGDSPIIGAGTYADNRSAAISATGHGELFMRHVAAYDVVALMRYKGLGLAQAAKQVIGQREGLRGGLIAVDAEGRVAMPFNTVGMVRGVVRELGKPVVELY